MFKFRILYHFDCSITIIGMCCIDRMVLKRNIFQFIVSQYDRLGILVPVIVRFKLFLQKSMEEK